jgi:hypothetical protein
MLTVGEPMTWLPAPGAFPARIARTVSERVAPFSPDHSTIPPMLSSAMANPSMVPATGSPQSDLGKSGNDGKRTQLVREDHADENADGDMDKG